MFRELQVEGDVLSSLGGMWGEVLLIFLKMPPFLWGLGDKMLICAMIKCNY